MRMYDNDKESLSDAEEKWANGMTKVRIHFSQFPRYQVLEFRCMARF